MRLGFSAWIFNLPQIMRSIGMTVEASASPHTPWDFWRLDGRTFYAGVKAAISIIVAAAAISLYYAT